jgi:hypothetical protein
LVRDDATSCQLFARARWRRNSGADRPHAHLGSEAAMSVPPHGVHLKHCLRTLGAPPNHKSLFAGQRDGLAHRHHPTDPRRVNPASSTSPPPPTWGSLVYVCVACTLVSELTEGRRIDDHSGPPRAVRRQQKPRHPPVYPRPPSEADPAWCHSSRLHCYLPRIRAQTDRSTPGRRCRTTAPLAPQARRHDPVLHLALPPHTRDHRGHPAHPDLGRPLALALPPQQDQGLRGAPAARARLWQLPAMFSRDGAHVAGEGRLRTLLLPHTRR